VTGKAAHQWNAFGAVRSIAAASLALDGDGGRFPSRWGLAVNLVEC
jgi:hypothetical protein